VPARRRDLGCVLFDGFDAKLGEYNELLSLKCLYKIV